MFYRTIIFVCLVGFVLVKTQHGKEQYHSKTAPTEIIFNSNIIENIGNNKPTTTCDHNYHNDTKQINKYTALEGKTIKIIVKHKVYINDFFCTENRGTVFNKNISKNFNGKGNSFIGIFQVEKEMGTLWKCTILTNRDNPTIPPLVHYGGHNYTATYCYMNIHVRQIKPPQTILVNNMALPARRTDLSNIDVDFTAEYQYADGDVVNVLCANLIKTAPLTMEYAMADKLSDKFNSTHLSSVKGIGFVATLHSEHDNTYMICTNTEPTDYTIFKVKFAMRTEFNVVSIKINGMTMRPMLTHAKSNHYDIDYMYLTKQKIQIVCEVNGTDTKLVVTDIDFDGKISSYKKTGIELTKKAEISFQLGPGEKGKKLCVTCSSDFITGGNVETVGISFTSADSLLERYNTMHMEMPSNGTVMELYNHDELKVVFYEYEEGDTLKLNCSAHLSTLPGVLYLKFEGSELSNNNHSAVKTLNLSGKDGKNETCYLIEPGDESDPSIEDKVRYEIRVILRKKVLISTTSAATPTIASQTEAGQPLVGPTAVSSNEQDKTVPITAMIAGVVVCIIIICISFVIIKLRKRDQSQGGPNVSNYENLQTPSENSIPPYPPQWESNYAVPVDRRTDDTTYSVPCQEPALYSVPTPKNQRNKKQKTIDPTYSILDVQNSRGRKNVFKETEDPNYSEVYANRKEQCYAKVLPKSVRNKMEQEYNPYSTVTSEPSYANTDSEPMYCEPSTAARAQGGLYANTNNTNYVNTNAQEYVEPTYCEPQKRTK